jgi:hypothetical protein
MNDASLTMRHCPPNKAHHGDPAAGVRYLDFDPVGPDMDDFRDERRVDRDIRSPQPCDERFTLSPPTP